MNFKEIQELLKFIDKSSLSYLELKENNFYIKIDKSLNRNVNSNSSCNDKEESKKSDIQNTLVEEIKAQETNNEKELVTNKVNDKEEFILSPMVGTFYSRPAPDKENFVKIGDNISKGTIVCIIEAMKLMNEIECEFDGEVIEVLARDGDMVEYNQPLFKIKK